MRECLNVSMWEFLNECFFLLFMGHGDAPTACTALFPFGVIYCIPSQGAAQFFLLNGKKNVSLQGEINTKAPA